MQEEFILEIQGLTKEYRVQKGFFDTKTHVIRALDHVDLSLKKGEILGLVGESGCGKSTLARLVLALENPTSGQVRFRGQAPFSMDKARFMSFRKRVQMVFQDPSSSLNPKKTVFQTLSEPMKIHHLYPKAKIRDKVAALLEEVGLDPDSMNRYPHQFSGGQRQRIGLARALVTNPEVIVADEPTSALDVSIQAQIINLLLDLKDSRELSFLFISHDLPVVQFVSHRVAVMYQGQLVELVSSQAFLDQEQRLHHPYTQYLIGSVPLPEPQRRKKAGKRPGERLVIAGLELDDVLDKRSSGCAFYSRCQLALDICKTKRPDPIVMAMDQIIWCHNLHTEKIQGKL